MLLPLYFHSLKDKIPICHPLGKTFPIYQNGAFISTNSIKQFHIYTTADYRNGVLDLSSTSVYLVSTSLAFPLSLQKPKRQYQNMVVEHEQQDRHSSTDKISDGLWY